MSRSISRCSSLVLLVLAACAGRLDRGPEIVFATQPAVSGPREAMQALLFGRLQVVDGCLRIRGPTEGVDHVPIWPPGYGFRTVGAVGEIRTESGSVVLRVGNAVRLSGGETTGTIPRGLEPPGVERLLAERCEGPFWIVGNEVQAMTSQL